MGFLSRAINRSLLSKGKYEREQEVTGQATVFETSASIDEVKQQLKRYVITVDTLPTVIKKELAVEQETDNMIVYQYGNKFADSFRSAVRFGEQAAIYQVLNWLQSDGVSPDVDAMESLRDNVIQAFKAADSNVKVSSTINE
jgi:hypothetical protein